MEYCHATLELLIRDVPFDPIPPDDAEAIPSKSLSSFSDPDELLISILNIGHNIASGLDFIHQHSAVHRDLKPRNGM